MKKRRELLSGTELRNLSADLPSDRWIDSELATCALKDARHFKRLRNLLGQLSASLRWMVNSVVSWSIRISTPLAGHFQATDDCLAGNHRRPS
jgi:hypothetical protein